MHGSGWFFSCSSSSLLCYVPLFMQTVLLHAPQQNHIPIFDNFLTFSHFLVNLNIQVLSNALTCSLSLAAASTAKAPQKTAPQRNLGSKGSPSSSLQRLPNLSSALPATSGPSTTGAWKGSPNASTPAARSSAMSSTVKTTSKTTKERTYVFLFVLC